MGTKLSLKLNFNFSSPDFRRVESKRTNQIVFTFAGDKTYSFRPNTDGPGSGAVLGATADASMQQATCDNILFTLIQAVRRIFPGVPVEHVLGPFDVVPQVSNLTLEPLFLRFYFFFIFF